MFFSQNIFAWRTIGFFYCQYPGLSLSLKDLQDFLNTVSTSSFMDKMKFVKEFCIENAYFKKKNDRQYFISVMYVICAIL